MEVPQLRDVVRLLDAPTETTTLTTSQLVAETYTHPPDSSFML